MTRNQPTRDSGPKSSCEGGPMKREARNPFARAMKDPPLSRAQLRALEEVKDTLGGLMRWHGKTHEEIEKDREDFYLCYADYTKAMLRAIRAGLSDHPLVKPWLVAQRAVGNRDTLRRARSGVEKGIKRPWTKADVRLWDEIRRLAEEHEEQEGAKLSQARARKFLVARTIIRRMSRQGFHKLLKRLNLLHYFAR